MSTKCLLLETKEKKRIFTLIGNKKHLKEYCEVFGAKMFVVSAEIEKSKIMNLQKLVPVLCDKNHEGSRAEFKILKPV